MSNAAIPDSNEMALDRTWLAHERTLMAWVRTATSMISFGFTIYKFFQFETGKAVSAKHALLSPRDFGLIMISIGLISLMGAAISNHKEVRWMKAHMGKRYSLAEVIAWIVCIFGVLALLSAFFRS